MSDTSKQPFEALLNPIKARADVTEHFGPQLEVLEDMINYGTYLLPRCLNSSSKSFHDLVVLPVHFRHALTMADGAAILLREGAVHTVQLQVRALFESSIYIQWVLAEDSDRRARTFYVANLRRRLEWAKRAKPDSAEQESFLEEFRSSGLDTSRIGQKIPSGEAERQIADTTRLLSTDKYSDLSRLFDERRKGRPYDPEWYAVLLPPRPKATLKTLASALKRRAEYRMIYQQASEVMHAALFDTHIHITRGEVRVWPLRELRSFGNTARLLMGQLLHLYQVLLAHYRPEEQENFGKIYIERWRQAYLHLKTISYRDEVID